LSQDKRVSTQLNAPDPPESGRVRGGGFTVWLTGLSGAGKTTIAYLLGPELERRGHLVEYLDGDVVRPQLSRELGFSKQDRDTNVERIGWVAARLVRHGAAVLAPVVSPYQESRSIARALTEAWGPFVEVFVKASLEECVRRDVKGLYAAALRGELKGLTGFDDPYETPESPELVVATEETEPEEAADVIFAKLDELGLVLPSGDAALNGGTARIHRRLT
jgi:adenylyl-sulfate kinase